ncbi:MAG: signal peptidase I [Oscillospiraceae bacterium]|nr:signal peptidase I [Oscillospiraceae bacterium]
MDTDKTETTAPKAEPEKDKKASDAQMKPKKKRTAKSYAISFFIKVFVTLIVLTVVFRFIAGIHICHTNCAYPTIRDGEFILTYRLADLKQGTMIVYRRDGEVRFGRVIAFSGDKVNIFNDFISVNDYGISENAVYPTSPEGSAISYPYQVPENCVFVLNDFRSDISDSRTYGGIPLEDVEGAVVFTMRMRGI